MVLEGAVDWPPPPYVSFSVFLPPGKHVKWLTVSKVGVKMMGRCKPA